VKEDLYFYLFLSSSISVLHWWNSFRSWAFSVFSCSTSDLYSNWQVLIQYSKVHSSVALSPNKI